MFHKQIRMRFRPKNLVYRLSHPKEQQNQFCNLPKYPSF